MTPQQEIQALLVNLSQEAAQVLQGLVVLQILAVQSRGYHPSNTEESKRIGRGIQGLRDDELYYLADRTSTLTSKGVGIQEFFKVEVDRREGRILAWIYRGLHGTHKADILKITLRAEPPLPGAG